MNEFDRIKREERRKYWEEHIQKRGRGGRIWAGIFILIVGIIALMKSFNVPMPEWLFTWQMLLIGIGLFTGLRHGFRRGGWVVPILIGGAFLANDYFLQGEMKAHLWPVVLIVLGLIFILKPRNHRWHMDCEGKKKRDYQPEIIGENRQTESNEEFIDSVSIFGSSKKNILTKNFRGGDIVNIFGGTELNLSQADIRNKATLEVTAIFGGAKLIVPSSWVVKTEVVSIFGGVTDERPLSTINENPDKILVLKGTVLFGGIDIKSY